MKSPEYRPEHRGVTRRAIFGALGLRPPIAEHTVTEGDVLTSAARGAKTIVEIGVAEGVSATELRRGMAPDGDLYLIDPYAIGLGRLGPARFIAHRQVEAVARGRVTWLEDTSQNLVSGWTTPIDFLFIDGDHSYEGVKADWDGWTPHLAEGGKVALHDAFPIAWAGDDSGPVVLLREVLEGGDWEIVSQAQSLAVLQRR